MCASDLHGRLRLLNPWGAYAPQPLSASGQTGRSHAAAQGRELKCADRAGLMRALSEDLAAFGADYYDGLSLRGERGSVHIFPCGDRSALRIEAEGENAPAICRSWEHYAGEMERRRTKDRGAGASGGGKAAD